MISPWFWAAIGLGVLAMANDSRQPVQYKPNSPELTALLAAAAAQAGLPTSWASDPATHELIRRESGGWVGRPNYTIPNAGNKALWPSIWEQLRSGAKIAGASDAAGLGQLLPANMDAFAPNGRRGYGVAIEEAIAFLRYVSKRYGSPAVALSMHGKLGKYVNARTGITQTKGFKEGY
jgi:SLT domain-containing protein